MFWFNSDEAEDVGTPVKLCPLTDELDEEYDDLDEELCEDDEQLLLHELWEQLLLHEHDELELLQEHDELEQQDEQDEQDELTDILLPEEELHELLLQLEELDEGNTQLMLLPRFELVPSVAVIVFPTDASQSETVT